MPTPSSPSWLSRPWSRWLGAEGAATGGDSPELTWVTTNDGLRLALLRISPAAASAPREPVLLIHGLGSNRLGFDFPGRSLAKWLAQAGYDVFVGELRGHGASERPRTGWTLDDYLERDLPALIRAVTEQSGRSQLHYMGHSMGGLLAFLLGTHGDASQLRSAVAVGSALDYRPGASGFREFLRFRPLAARVPMLPYGAFTHWLSPLYGRGPLPLDAFNLWRTNVEPELSRRLHANAFETIPTSLLLQLATAFDGDGLTSADGRVRYLEATHPLTTRTLLVGGSRDPQATPEAIRASAELLGSNATQLHFGRAHGNRDDYGHWDLLIGRRAQTEVWPNLLSWLQRHPIG